MRSLPHNEFVTEINRLYHEEEAAVYDSFHPEIMARERVTWKRLAGFLKKDPQGIRVLDIGSGTGFVPEALAGSLGANDLIALCDISPKMLDAARKKFATYTEPKFTYHVADGEKLPFPDGYFDAVTMNSVLHHLPRTAEFLREVDRVLAPGGSIMIAHEPNRDFMLNPLLRSIVWFVRKWKGLKNKIGRLSGAAANGSGSHDVYEAIYRRVNERLREEGCIVEDLAPSRIQAYVDIHSPTATGREDPSKGFSPRNIVSENFPAYELTYLATMAHLGKYSADARGVFAVLEKVIAQLFPLSGSSFALVAKKSGKY